jgi:hypothetical protein
LTEGFAIGQRVRVNDPGQVCDGMTGEVVNLDAYTVEVRFETVTEEMKEYEDTRTGLANFEPKNLTIL